jgi:hypothetical protein
MTRSGRRFEAISDLYLPILDETYRWWRGASSERLLLCPDRPKHRPIDSAVQLQHSIVKQD